MYILECKHFTELEELEYLTGLSIKELWDMGVDLDDYTCFFQTNEKINSDKYWRLILKFDSMCDWQEYEINGKYYYIIYHA